MSRKQFSHRERRAYFEAYGEKCAYCPNAIEKQLYMEIDHVIYQALAERPSELKEVLKRHGLPDTFDLNGPLNLVCACKNCNSKKGATRPVATIDFGLKAAREKEPIVKRLLEKYRINKSVDNNLTSVGDDLEKGNTTREYVADFLGISKAASKPESVLQESELLRILGNASLGLAEWPQKTANQWMERPELDSILTRFDLPNSFTVLLGEPGSGKSALLAHIAGILTDRDVVHLALKADLLPPELATLGELNEYLGTPAPVVECLKELAESRPIVFLIDQLDAVCDLMVQKTARLTVLLGLINRLRGIENFHILLSCRSFEFRHDIRLNSLKPDAVILSDPPFAVVQQVLASSNIDSTMWPDEAKELLRRPQHLNFFLGHLTATESQRMLTYHSMMESVFQVRVLRPFGNETARTLEAIATTMSEEENLWLPLSRLEVNYGREVDRLLATGLLARSPDNLRVGFRHQTIFDFMRARAFASGVSNLAAYILERQDSLFVRPILWGTLHYLREADRKAYVREVQTLWVNLDLRQHIRFLLIDFVAQVQEPDSFEVAIIRPALSDRELRPHVVKCLKGNPAWFVCIKADMFSMMAGNDVEAYYASWLLRPALEFDAGNAISLIERFWIPNAKRDFLTIQTLGDLKKWDERSIAIAERVVRRSPQQGVWVRHLEGVVSQHRPDLVPRLVVATLWGLLEKAAAEPVVVPDPPIENASEAELFEYAFRWGDAGYAALKEIVTDSNNWHGISKVANEAPRAFVETILPWVTFVASKHTRVIESAANRYCEDPIFDYGHRFHEDLTSGLDAAFSAFAADEPDAFLSFANQHKNSELQSVHSWLAMGYCRLGQIRPQECVEYLLGDPRRLALGPTTRPHKLTIELISAFIPSANPDAVASLEAAISKWSYYLDSPSVDKRLRLDRMKWNREARLRLLRVIPSRLHSTDIAELLKQEERAITIPPEPDSDSDDFSFRPVESVLAAEKMALAKKEDLLHLFDELHDGTGWNHPRDFMKGGVIETSREFGRLAEICPDLVLSILCDLNPDKHSHYASEALQKIAASQNSDPAELCKLIHQMSDRGFRSEVFRYGASMSLAKLAERLQGLDDDTCTLIEGWLEDWTENANREDGDEATEVRGSEQKASSVLWGFKSYTLPQGNFPHLSAIFLGYMLRATRDANAWLRILEVHSLRHEDPRVWVALAGHHLRFLWEGDRERASSLLVNILRQPQVLNSENAARLIARVHHWVPQAIVHLWMDRLLEGGWWRGPQAVAELAMLRHALVPEDLYCKQFVERILIDGIQNCDQLSDMRYGVTSAAAELWDEPSTRLEATRVLLAILPCDDEPMVHAWRGIFHREWTIVDGCTAQVLDALCKNREILRAPHGDQLVDRLKDLLENGLEQERVGIVVSALLDECGDKVGDFRTSWAASAGDLIDIALTLQRLPGTSLSGLQLFERLMAGNAYQIEEVLKSLDRRWPS